MFISSRLKETAAGQLLEHEGHHDGMKVSAHDAEKGAIAHVA